MKITPNPNRYGNTRKKNVTLTNEGHDQIETYAQAHGLTFSAAIEALALIGMEADITSLLIPLINTSVEKGLQRQFNRMAKLILLAAAEAAMAHDLSTMLLLQVIRREAVTDPDHFEEVMQVQLAGDGPLESRVRTRYLEMRQIARKRQRRLLKQPLRNLVAHLDGAALETVGDEENTDA